MKARFATKKKTRKKQEGPPLTQRTRYVCYCKERWDRTEMRTIVYRRLFFSTTVKGVLIPNEGIFSEGPRPYFSEKKKRPCSVILANLLVLEKPSPEKTTAPLLKTTAPLFATQRPLRQVSRVGRFAGAAAAAAAVINRPSWGRTNPSCRKTNYLPSTHKRTPQRSHEKTKSDTPLFSTHTYLVCINLFWDLDRGVYYISYTKYTTIKPTKNWQKHTWYQVPGIYDRKCKVTYVPSVTLEMYRVVSIRLAYFHS